MYFIGREGRMGSVMTCGSFISLHSPFIRHRDRRTDSSSSSGFICTSVQPGSRINCKRMHVILQYRVLKSKISWVSVRAMWLSNSNGIKMKLSTNQVGHLAGSYVKNLQMKTCSKRKQREKFKDEETCRNSNEISQRRDDMFRWHKETFRTSELEWSLFD